MTGDHVLERISDRELTSSDRLIEGLPAEEVAQWAASHGECPKHRFIRTPDGEPGLNYLCAGYKLFFNYVRPYMDFMAAELQARRPAANVMEFARQRQIGRK